MTNPRRPTPAEQMAKVAWAQHDAAERENEHIRFFEGLLNALAFMLCVAALVGLYLVLPA